MTELPTYKIERVPLSRRVVVDSSHIGFGKHVIFGLLEVDVTDARRMLHEHKAQTGESLSFTAFIAACLGRAVAADPRVHGYRDWRGWLVMFDDVDITVSIEIELEERAFPLAHTIRSANTRTVHDIHAEIRAIQANPQRSLGAASRRRAFKWFLRMPAFVRRSIYRLMFMSPRVRKQNIGTVLLTAVGMFGQGGGWGITPTVYTLGVVLGGIAEKPGVVDGQIVIREYLSVTIGFDHDIIDGAPAARFSQRFKELIEQGYGLES